MSEHHFQTALPVACDACAVATGSTPSAAAKDQRIATEAEMKLPMKPRASAPLAALAVTFGVVHQVANHAYPTPRRSNWRWCRADSSATEPNTLALPGAAPRLRPPHRCANTPWRTTMKKILLIALTPLMTLSAGASVAQMPQVEVTAPALRDITRQQATEFEGLYWMSDGRRMKLWRQGSRIVASLDGAPNAELGLVGSHWLRSSNGRFDVRFTSQPDSPRTELTVTLSGSDDEAIVALSATPAR